MSPTARTRETKKNYSINSSKLDRKTVERNRRMHMKGLCFKLSSLIPKHHNNSTKEVLSQKDLLGYAAFYIKEVRDRVESLKRQKKLMVVRQGANTGIRSSTTSRAITPVLELRDMDSTLEVTLITGLHKSFTFHQVLGVLEEEGAIVVNANFSTIGDRVFHTIHSQVTSSRVGVDTPRLHQRLKKLISSFGPLPWELRPAAYTSHHL